MKEALTERMRHAAAHVEVYDQEWEAQQLRDGANEIDALTAAITGLLKFHQEGDDGAELPREYWSPGYREAVEIAEALVGSNVELTGAAPNEQQPKIKEIEK